MALSRVVYSEYGVVEGTSGEHEVDHLVPPEAWEVTILPAPQLAPGVWCRLPRLLEPDRVAGRRSPLGRWRERRVRVVNGIRRRRRLTSMTRM